MKNKIKNADGIIIHGSEVLPAMRKAGKTAAEMLDYITPFVKIGVTTEELDSLCCEYAKEHGAINAPLGYRGFPKSICTSVNHVVCHGIPGNKVLKNGDIVNIDVTAIVDGWYGDTSRMFIIGKANIKAKKLIDVTYECLMRAIDIVKPGATLGDIGSIIQSHAESHRFSVVRDFCGHGIGQEFHTKPNIMHYGRKGRGEVLEEGMIFTIEPMINSGKADTKILADNWTAVTKDKSLSAQFEHTMVVTADGCEIFTLSPKGFHKPPYDV